MPLQSLPQFLTCLVKVISCENLPIMELRTLGPPHTYNQTLPLLGTGVYYKIHFEYGDLQV